MLFLLRGAQTQGSKIRVGLVTNGDEWVLVHVAPNETATYVTWSSELFFDEPLTLRAFHSLLGQKRFFGVADSEVLEALFEASSKDQHDVTDQLGLQVRRAVEILVQTIDRLDRDRGRVLLKGIPEAMLYESAVTVMMRLVFLFAAEERTLLLLGTPLYDENYAVSTLHDQLQATADRHGEEVLERRHDAWSRLLATFRGVFGGIDHIDLRLPAYGGSLFDPDRFPFLEGRTPGTSWGDANQHTASPLAIDNRTVLQLLRALQRLQIRFAGGGPAESRRLSFRALDIEQIGHVYEGLLDHTAKRATGLTLSLDGKKELEIAVADLEAMRTKEKDAFPAWLAEATGRSAPAIERALQYEIPKEEQRRWLAVCDSRRPVYERVAPWAGLVRDDSHGNPVVIDEGAVYVTEGSDRRSTGTHYTPRSLTEPIVQHALDPLVYDGPAEGKPRDKWVLKPPKNILALRVCDLAMGSGAFLVQACRYLSQKLVEGWETAEKNAGDKLVLAPNGELSKGKPGDTLVPRGVEERLVLARRFIADRCLYGVDVNPMAVEMAKLSLWLVTLQKDRPFSFVDHALRCGDSLLGVTSEDQLLHFHLDPVRGKRLHDNLLGLDKKMKAALARSRELREKLESFPVRDISDSKQKAWLFDQANEATEDLRAIGDLLIGAALAMAGKKEGTLDDALRDLSPMVAGLLNAGGDARARKRGEVLRKAAELLNAGREEGQPPRTPFHWAVQFPEVVQRGGFEAFVGNPPFMGGKRITTALGEHYTLALKYHVGNRKGAADLAAHFLVRAFGLLHYGLLGLILTNSINEGDTRDVGLSETIRQGGVIYRARTNYPWPGEAGVAVSLIHVARRPWVGTVTLEGRPVARISEYLASGSASGEPHRLNANTGIAATGTYVNGAGFVIDAETRNAFVAASKKNEAVLFPYLTSQDLNQRPRSDPSRYVINFDDMSRSEAERYGAPFRHVFKEVKPVRDKLTRQVHEACFWKHWDRRESFYEGLRRLKRALVLGRVSTFHAVTFMDTKWIVSDGVVIFMWDAWRHFALLQSGIHETWCARFRTSLETRPRYSVSDCFMTFPLPEASVLESHAEDVGERYFKARAESLDEGLTSLYHRFHDPDEKSAPIRHLRSLHVEMDHAVMRAYGWEDLPLDHCFDETKQGRRYTMGEPARIEVLDRLLTLNNARCAEETGRLHGSDSKMGKANVKLSVPVKGKQGRKRQSRVARQSDLFDSGDDE